MYEEDCLRIRRKLEATYDIPFEVTGIREEMEPCFWIHPKDEDNELFNIKIAFRNKVRLVLEFQPQRYGAVFMESMGRQPKENKNRFLKYAELMKNQGARLNLKVNGAELPSDVECWPDYWQRFEGRVTKMPVSEEESIPYGTIAEEWGSLMVGMILCLADIVPVEDEPADTAEIVGYQEGNIQRILVNRYERNPLNRKLCLAVKGYSCAVCGMNFEEAYGEIGVEFIHVHHVTPVSQIGPDYIIDPVEDLEPVCPNCHAMLHRTNPPMLPAELRHMYLSHRKE